ncbi:hypothetical protein D3C71_1327770 [compost metagenome]
MIISDVSLRFMLQRHVAENTAHAPHILIFQIAPVTPAQHHHRQTVAARFQHSGEIELGRQPAVLGVPHPLAVTPEIKRRVHPVKNDARLSTLQPLLLHLKCERVTTRGVLSWHKGRIDDNRISDIGINRRIEALHLPVRWYRRGDCIHRIFHDPFVRNVFRGSEKAELPLTVQRPFIRRALLITRLNFIAPAAKRRMSRQTVPLRDTGVFPVTAS